MLKNNMEIINKILDKEKKFQEFNIFKYLDTNKLNSEIKTLLKTILKPSKYSDYMDVSFYTTINYYSGRISSIRIWVSFAYDFDLLRFELNTNYKNEIKVETLKLFLEDNKSMKLKSNDLNIIKLKNILYDIKSQLEPIMTDIILNENNEDSLYLKSIQKEIKLISKDFRNKVFFNIIDNDKLSNLIKNILNIKFEDFEYRLYLSNSYKDNNEILISLYMFPNDLLKYNTINIFNLNYNKVKDSYKIENNISKDFNYLKNNLDIVKNVKNLNKYILEVFKN